MSQDRFENSNLTADMEHRVRLQDSLTALSEKDMGINQDGETHNLTQIIAVIQALYHLQQLRERFEAVKATDPVIFKNLEDISYVKRILIKNAKKFEQLVTNCLLSYTDSSQKIAVTYLEELQTLYATSYAVIDQTLEQYQSDLAHPSAKKAAPPDIEPINHAQVIKQIQLDFDQSYQRASVLITQIQNNSVSTTDELTTVDEAIYLRNHILDAITIEIQNMERSLRDLEKEYPFMSISIPEREALVKSTEAKLKDLSRSHATLIFSSTQLEGNMLLGQNTPRRPHILDQKRFDKIQKRTQSPQVDTVNTEQETQEKKELLSEITRIKQQIQTITNNLHHEIPKALLNKDLKTYKRNKLLELSRQLYVHDNASLDDLRACAKNFQESLQACQKDAKLRQGIMRKNCRTLIDSLAKDLEQDQHVFMRHKNNR